MNKFNSKLKNLQSLLGLVALASIFGCGAPGEARRFEASSANDAHFRHGDSIGASGVRPGCSRPPLPLQIDSGTEPREDEPSMISEAVAKLEHTSETGYYAASSPISFRLSCPTLKPGPESIVVYDNGVPLPYEALTVTADGIVITNGLPRGRHSLKVLALDIYGYTIDYTFTIRVGSDS